MNELWIAIFVQAVGVALLVLEVFVPSHGLLAVAGIGCIGGGVWMAFRIGALAGYSSLAAEVVIIPVVAAIGVRVFPRTAFGRRVAPPNPVLTDRDTSVDVSTLRALVGRAGRAVSTLRPVGICDFDGRRIPCVAESGMIEPGTDVEGVSVIGGNLAVRPRRIEGGG